MFLDVKSNCYSSYYLYVVRVIRLNFEMYKIVIEILRVKGIFVYVYYIFIYF